MIDVAFARQLIDGLPLQPEARVLWRSDMTGREFLDTLRGRACHVDGLHVLPHLLERRRAVWWACLCCFDAYRDAVTPAQAEAFAVTLGWLRQPSEANRLACLDRNGAQPGLNSAESCLRMSACWSGGSLASADLPEVMPPPDLTARLSAAAVLIAASSGGMFVVARRHRLYLDLGYEILEGRLPWQAASPAALREAVA